VNNQTVIGKAANFNICFRDVALSSYSGALLLKDFCDQLGVAEVLDSEVKVKHRHSGYSDAEAILGLTWNLILGGDCLFDLNVLRGDKGTLDLLGLDCLIAPTTAGEHLRKFDIGDKCDLLRAMRLIAQRVRPRQNSDTCTIDLDSSVYEQCSTSKEGSCRAYNGMIGYHPLLAFWAEEGELLATHLLAGNRHPSSKAVWFLGEVLKQVSVGLPLKLRADSAFYTWDFINELERRQIIYAITADLSEQIKKQIEAIEEKQWRRFGKDAKVAELRYAPERRKEHRYVVKRVWLTDKKGRSYWSYHAVITNEEKKSAGKVMKWALQRCNMENLIKEHKSGFGLEKMPTQKFLANQVWLLIGQLAFNLVAWFKRLVLPEQYQKATIKTIRHQILNLGGKIVESGRRFYLILSEHYHYQDVWRYALKQLAKLAT
jgi:hypothetical protein